VTTLKPEKSVVLSFSKYASEAAKVAFVGMAHPSDSEDERNYIAALAGSDSLFRELEVAGLSDRQVEGFIATVLALRTDYSLFRREVSDARQAQEAVRVCAANLVIALKHLSRYEIVRADLRYMHDFLQSSGLLTPTCGPLSTLVPLASLIESLHAIAASDEPTQEGYVEAAIKSQKSSGPHELTRALLHMTPCELRERLCPAIATVVSLAHPAAITVQEVRRLAKDFPQKKD